MIEVKAQPRRGRYQFILQHMVNMTAKAALGSLWIWRWRILAGVAVIAVLEPFIVGKTIGALPAAAPSVPLALFTPAAAPVLTSTLPRPLTMASGQGRDPHVNGLAAHAQGDATVLR